jgi:hypothetical protein
VVNPEFFVRCGYPMTVHDELQKVLDEQSDGIKAFLRECGVPYDGWPQNFPAVQQVARIIAYERCKAAKWGGKQRAIYTKRFDDLAGETFVVQSVRFVKTGEYCPGHNGYDDDYNPPYLLDEKTHRIVQTRFTGQLTGEMIESLEIEAVHLEKVEESNG